MTLNKSIQGISPLAAQRLRTHHWPGNVRELRNVMERAAILETATELQAASLPEFQLETRLRRGLQSPEPGQSLEDAVAQFERELITETLARQHYNLAKTADQLRITRHALRYRMSRLQIPGQPEAATAAGAGPPAPADSKA